MGGSGQGALGHPGLTLGHPGYPHLKSSLSKDEAPNEESHHDRQGLGQGGHWDSVKQRQEQGEAEGYTPCTRSHSEPPPLPGFRLGNPGGFE